jgi:hypothetical protein
MPQYKIIKQINAGSGYLKDINGNMVSMQSLAPKVGGIINGTIETKYMFNQYMTGISFPITTGRNDVAGNSQIFIPKDSVRPADIPAAPSSNNSLIQEFQLIKPFSTTYSVGGFNPLRTYSKKSMESIKGVREGDFVRVKLGIGVPIQGAQDSLLIPMSYLSLPSGLASTKPVYKKPTVNQDSKTEVKTSQTNSNMEKLPVNFKDLNLLDESKFPKLPVSVRLTEDVEGKTYNKNGDSVPVILKKDSIFKFHQTQESGSLKSLYNEDLKIWLPYEKVAGKAEFVSKTDSSNAKLNVSDDKILGLPKNTVILLALAIGGFVAYKYFKK